MSSSPAPPCAQPPPTPAPRPFADLPPRLAGLPPAALVQALRADQVRRWRAGQRVRAEDYLAAFPALAGSPEDALVLIWGEVLLRQQQGEAPDAQEYGRRFPHLRQPLALQFHLERALAPTGSEPTQPAAAPAGPTAVPQVPGYELLGELGRGGMGVVYK